MVNRGGNKKMGEKRFEMRGDTHILDSKTSEEYYAPCEWGLVNLLNNLAEECGRLEFGYLHTNHRCIPYPIEKLESKIKLLEKENEQLKQELSECTNHKLYTRRKLEKENKELKEQLDKIPKGIKKVWIEE